MKNRSKLKEALRPLVKEALSDYLKDSEEETRALQAAHPQLDIEKDLPSETSSGDNVTRGVRTEVASAFDPGVVTVLNAVATKRPITKMKSQWLQDALKVCKASSIAEPHWAPTIAKELQKRGLKEGLEGDLQALGAKGTNIQKSGGKTIVHLSNPKLAQKVADRLNDSGEYEVEVMKDGGILVKYQSPVTKFDETYGYRPDPKLLAQVQKRWDELRSKGMPPFKTLGKLGSEFKIKNMYVKAGKIQGFEPLEQMKEASTTAGVPGYQTPYAFSDTGISKDVKKRKIAQQLGYKLVKKEGLKEEMRVNIVKAVPLNEGFRPQLQSLEAKALHDKIDYYMMISSDPHYRQIHKFRVAISKLKNPNDQKQMIQYFNDEFKINWGSAAQSAWEYYKKVD